MILSAGACGAIRLNKQQQMMLQDFELNDIEKWLPEASVKYKDGSPAVNPGLIITVFFKDGYTSEVRRNMVECVDRCYGEFRS